MASANLKAFVSESELEEQRQLRQEEWEKVRTADQPEECPEEQYDPRSLFEKLQEQKDKKQSDFDEQFKFKNMIRGIDEEESSFLNDVAEKQMKIEVERMTEERKLINEYKESVVTRTIPTPSQSTSVAPKPSDKKVSSGSKRSQAALLAGAVKRKRPNSVDDSKSPNSLPSSSESKSTPKPSLSSAAAAESGRPSQEPVTHPSSVSGDSVSASKQTAQCIAILPGIGSYSNSSEESDSDSSDSEGLELIRTVFHTGGRRHKIDAK